MTETILWIIGTGFLNALGYESPYWRWIKNMLGKPEEGMRLFFMEMIQCLACYSFWINIFIFLMCDFGIISIPMAAMSSVLGEKISMWRKKI